ncbi:zinc finger protein 709-like isoform X1 [Littorina saxatilis]|uniref:zinc finger protein 709-like isoform X1 n=1 Tax=Littorina saxatilis TaxID=31220 RepID=UPI0038B53979
MAATSEEEGSPPILSDYVKLYNAVVEFKHNLATVFLEKGLLEEKSKLEAINAVTMGTDAVNMMSQVQQFTADIVLAFNLIAELIKSNISNKTTVQAAENTVDAESQTDLTPGNLVIQALDTSLVKTEKDPDEYWDELHPTFSPVGVMESAKTPETAQPTRRKSARTLKRKALESKPAVGAKKRKQGEVVKIQGRGGDQKKILALVPSDLARAHKGGVLATNLYERTPDGMFKCKECGKKATLQTNIRKHLRKHTGEREFPCSQCSKSFIYQQDLRRHLKTHTDAKPRKKSSKNSKAKNHTCEDFSASSDFKNTPSKSKTQTEECSSDESDEGTVKEETEESFAQDEPMVDVPIALPTDAMYVPTEEGWYRCVVCGTETKDRSNIRKHYLKYHAGEQRYQCSKCSKAFAYKESLKHHQKVHLDPSSFAFEQTPKGYRCKHCSHESKNRSNIVKHVKRRHLNAGEKPYQCSLCPAMFAYPRSLKRHELVHKGVRPFKCPECDKSFFDQTALRTHQRVHTSDRPYICQICGDRFRQSEGLKGHMRRHTGDKPFVCERCGMAFAAKRSLVRHIRVHTGERPYSCDQCVAAFADWTTLHNHKLVHRDPSAENAGDWQVTDGDGKIVVSETKPYQCQFCGIRYRQPLSLKRHLRIHATNNTDVKKSPVKKPRKRKQQDVEEGEIEEPTALHLQYRPYACELCGERFKHLRGYQTHKTKHENGTFTAKKTPAKRTKRDTALAQISNQEIEQAATILASVAVNSTSVTTSNNLPVIHAQPSSEAVTIIDASSITAMSMADTTQLFVADAPMVSNAGEVIHHFMPGDVTQVIRYPDGTLSHVTTLVPTHNPQPPPPPQPNISVMQPIDQLGNVTVLFETQDGNVVVDQTGSLA